MVLSRISNGFLAGALALLLSFGAAPGGSSQAQPSGPDWRALCVAGNEIEIRVGGSWYKATVIGPNVYGEAECAVVNTSYSGHELRFAMAPDRMRAIARSETPGDEGATAASGEAAPQAAWLSLCVPGREVEILIGSSWHRGTVIGPNAFGERECGVLNTSYSGHDLQFAMAPDRMRAVGGGSAGDAMDTQMQPPSAAAAAVTASLAEIGELYRTNTPAARERYENRTVTLEATLGRVGTDYIRLTDGPYGDAVCNFDEGTRAQLSSLEPGTQVKVQGHDSSWGWGTFQLKSCRILAVQPAQVVAASASSPASGQPPLGRYVCRQYMTTIGYIELGSGSYAVNGVQGGYDFDSGTGLIRWNGGAYGGWPAKYEFSPAGAGHAHDEHIIRMTDEAGRLKIDCFLMRE